MAVEPVQQQQQLMREDSFDAENAAHRLEYDIYLQEVRAAINHLTSFVCPENFNPRRSNLAPQRIALDFDVQYYEALSPLLRQVQHRQAAFQQQEAADVAMYQPQHAFQPPMFQPQPLGTSAQRANAFAMPRAGVGGGKRAAADEQAPAKRQRGVAQPMGDWLME